LVAEARSLPRVEHTRLERLARDKHSS